MDERSQAVLRAAVETYIASAEPVASRTLGRGEIALSSASIRAIMARLEHGGLLFQPHTSAGRVPTTAGYRTYVDQLMAPIPPGPGTVRTFSTLPADGLRPLMESTAGRLAATTGLTAFALCAVRDNVVHRHIEFIRLHPGEVLGIFATRSGTVQHRVIRTDTDIAQAELDRLANFLNQRFDGLTLRDIRAIMRDELSAAEKRYQELASRAYTLGDQALPDNDVDVDVVAVGQHQLLNQPEFAAAELAGPVLEELERQQTWLGLLDTVCSTQGLTVLIGSENTPQGFQHCSIVAAPIEWDLGVEGTLGLIGPTRLAYARVTALLQFLAHYIVDYASRRGHPGKYK